MPLTRGARHGIGKHRRFGFCDQHFRDLRTRADLWRCPVQPAGEGIGLDRDW